MNVSGIATTSPFFAASAMPHMGTPLQATPSPQANAADAYLSERDRPLESESDPLQLEQLLPRVRRADAIAASFAPSTPAPTSEEQPISARADALFAQAYSLIFREAPDQSREALHDFDRGLYECWRNLTDISEIEWKPAHGLPPTPLELAYAQSQFAIHLHTHPGTDDASARGLAHYYIFHRSGAAIGPPDLDALYQGVLQRGLHWIDLDAVRARRMSPSQILQTVCVYRGQSVSRDSSLSQRLRNYRDVIADETALIHFLSQPDCRDQPDCEVVARNTPIHAIRAQFATALIDEWQDGSIGMALLPSSPIAPEHAKFWFNGFSLQNAAGMRLQNIVLAIFGGGPYPQEKPAVQRFIDRASYTCHLTGYPGQGIIDAQRRQTLIREIHGDMSAMSRYERRSTGAELAGVHLTIAETHAIVAKRMRSLMLGTHYPQCTLLDALETTLLRLGPLHGIGLGAMHEPARLVKAYNKLNRAWRDNPRFVIAPSAYAGKYLTQCRNVLFLTNNAKLTADQQIAIQVAKLFLPALAAAVQPATKARQKMEIDYWGLAIWRYMGLHSLPDRMGVEDALPDRYPLHKGVQAAIDVRKNAAETIRYGNLSDLHRQLHDYMEEEMLTLSPLPKFDEQFQAGLILRRKLNMTDRDIRTPRSVQFITAGGVGARLGSTGAQMTPLEEFKLRAEQLNGLMTFGQRAIDVAKELRQARQAAAEELMDDPVIAAKSKEMMRRHGIAQNAENEQRIRRSMANSLAGIATPTLLGDFLRGLDMLFGSAALKTTLDALLSGEPRRILSLLPFVVPAYDIVMGLWERDWRRAGEGVLHLGEDAVLTALGMGAEKIMMAQLARDADAVLALRGRVASESAAGAMQELSELPQSTAEIEMPVAETSFIETAGMAIQTEPKTLAAGGILPDPRVQMTLYLIDEKRWVPVKPIEGAFVETDLHGNVRSEARIIFGDLATRRGYRLTRRRRAQPGGAIAEMPDPMHTATVTDVTAYWQRLSRMPNIWTRRADPKKIVKALFALADEAPSETLRQKLQRVYTRYFSYAEFEEFWLKAYQLSDTAMTILNAAYDRLPFTGNAEITFNADRAHVVGTDIHLLGTDALAGQQYVSLDGATAFERERMWIHEVLHALAGTADTEVLGERGETIWFTGRIMFELGHAKAMPTRLAYKMPPVFNRDPAGHRLWAEHLLVRHDMTIAQDLHLDRTVITGRAVAPSTMVFGEKIDERATVQQALALAEHMRTIPKFGNSNATRLFQLAAAVFESSARSDFPARLRTMIFASKTARELTYAWLQRNILSRIDVKFVDFELAGSRIDGPANAHMISGKRIWINTEQLYYFSEWGLYTLSPLRRQIGAIVDFLLREIMPSLPSMPMAGKFRNLGLGVLLENEIMEQIGDRSPPRICDALALDEGSYHRHLTTVRRAADLERYYLRDTIRALLEAHGFLAGDDLLGLSSA